MKGLPTERVFDLVGDSMGAFADGLPLPNIDPWNQAEDDSEWAVDLRAFAREITRLANWEPWPGAPDPSVRTTN